MRRGLPKELKSIKLNLSKVEKTELYNRVSKDAHLYYVRDENRQPVGSVAILLDCGVVCRGISICSIGEPFRKKKARYQAIERLYHAVLYKINSEQMRIDFNPDEFYKVGQKSIDRFIALISKNTGGTGFSSKSEFDVKPTNLESKILKVS